jgi:nicotinamidase/pyrazinamidase
MPVSRVAVAALFASAAGFASTPEDMPKEMPKDTPEDMPKKEKTALIIVDTQLCFTNGPKVGVSDPFDVCNPLATGGSDTCERLGSLGVATGQSIVPKINSLRNDLGCHWDLIVRSQDFHPANHISFGSRHFGSDPFSFAGGPLPDVGYPINLHCIKAESQMLKDGSCCLVDVEQEACTALPGGCTLDTDANNPACSACAGAGMASCTEMPMNMWTDHCLQTGETADSGFATGLETPDTDLVLQKGTHMNIDAYSIFMDNAKFHKTPLDEKLKEKGITKLVVVGIAYDFCVSWTAQDGAAIFGYDVTVIKDAAAPIGLDNPDGTTTIDTAEADMANAGVKIVTMEEAMASMATCPAGSRRRAEEVEPGQVIQLDQ